MTLDISGSRLLSKSNHSEVRQKYPTDEEALDYMVENNPELSKIEVLADRVDGTKVKIFGVGKVVEKFLVEKIRGSTATETKLRNEYLHKAQK